jgi:YVTN family beta-propeller protein
MEFRVLGSLEVVDHDGPVALGAPKQQALLAVLLLHHGEPVSSDLLIDEIWGEQPPASANKIVQGYVSNLRKVLGDGRLVTHGRGYLLQIEPGETDVDRFEALVAEGRRALEDGDALTAGAVLREALAVWRGPALSDFAYQPFAQAEIARLEESRLVVLEDRIDADLASGEHARLVGELEALVHEHPLRERLQGQLMLALYRSGRQADALETYHIARDRLIDELGLEPGPELKELERAILAQDPSLQAPPRASAVARRVQRGGALIMLGAVALLAACVLVAVRLSASGGDVLRVTPNSVAVIDPGTNRVVAQVSVGVAPEGIAVGAGGIWVANTADHTLTDIDPSSRIIVRTLPLAGKVDGVAADGGQLWALDTTDQGRALRIDPTFGSVTASVRLSPFWGTYPASPTAVAASGGSAWFADNAAAVVRVSGGGAILSTTNIGNHPSGIALGAGAAWVADDMEDTVSRIDSDGGVLATIPVGQGATGIAVGGGAVWVADTLDNSLVRIDPGTNSVTATIPVGLAPRGVAWGDGSVWVANSGGGTVSRVNPETDRVTATIPVGQSPQQLAATGGAVWVTIQAQPSAPGSAPDSPAGVLRVSRERPFPYLDPTRVGAFDQDEQQLIYETCAGLLTYPDRPGVTGERLVPDVATALPTVSADGRTYTFTIRPGFRFSPPSGAPVTAATFAHTIDRMLSPGDLGYERGAFGDIVGEAAFNASKTGQLAGVVAHGDKLQIRLTAPAPDLPARLAMLSFCAVPDDTPDAPQTQPIPSAGPYYIASSSRAQLILKRNPYYGGHRPRIPREVIYSFGEKYASAVNDVAAGRIDYVSSVQLALDANVPTSISHSLQQRYGLGSAAARAGRQRYFTNPTVTLDFFALNASRPLFASTRVRQAVNYAIDRQALVAVAGPYYGGEPTSHYLPPGMPGSRPDAVYPLGTPDLAEARKLAAGLHSRATMLTCNTPVCTQTAQIIQRELAPMGITVDIASLPIDAMSTRMATSNSWDIGRVTFSYDFADPSDYISGIFDPSLYGGGGGFGPVSPAWIKVIDHTFTLTGQARLANYGRLDDALANQAAPILAWATQSARDLFAPRVGCEIYQPLYGMDLGSLCLQ